VAAGEHRERERKRTSAACWLAWRLAGYKSGRAQMHHPDAADARELIIPRAENGSGERKREREIGQGAVSLFVACFARIMNASIQSTNDVKCKIWYEHLYRRNTFGETKSPISY